MYYFAGEGEFVIFEDGKHYWVRWGEIITVAQYVKPEGFYVIGVECEFPPEEFEWFEGPIEATQGDTP